MEIAMTMDAFIPARNRGRVQDAGTEPLYAPDDRELAYRWHEESKRRYEDMSRECLELAEQRQRCV